MRNGFTGELQARLTDGAQRRKKHESEMGGEMHEETKEEPFGG